MKIKIGTSQVDVKNAAKAIIFLFISSAIIILLYQFITNGIEWVGFVEFIISCLILIFLVEKVNIKIPGLFEIKNELGEIRRNLSVVAQNISNVKQITKITNVTPTSYEGPPIDIDGTSGTWTTGTTNPFTGEIDILNEDNGNE